MTQPIEIIRNGEARLAELEAKLQRVREDADADNHRTPEEQEAINKIAHRIAKLRGLIEEKRRLWENNKAQYETLRADVDRLIAALPDTDYVDLRDARAELVAKRAEVDALAAAEHYGEAKDALGTLRLVADSCRIGARQQQLLLENLTKAAPGYRSTLAAHAETTSSVKSAAEQNMALIEAGLDGSGSLKAASEAAAILETQLVELGHLKAAMDRLAQAAPDDLDDVSLEIVTELKRAGTLDQLPTELRRTLAGHMMEGEPTDAEHDALEEIFKLPHIDREFNAIDSQVRDNIVDAIRSDPMVKELSENWDKMSDRKRLKAVEELIKIPGGEDGWNVGTPENVKLVRDKDDDGHETNASYIHDDDTLEINRDGNFDDDFEEFLATLCHEMAHRYQMTLVEGLENSAEDQIRPGDPRYEQAEWLKLGLEYRRQLILDDENEKRYEDIYETYPLEAHSRQMAEEVEAGLRRGFKRP